MTVAVRLQTCNYGTASQDRPAPITLTPLSEGGLACLTFLSAACTCTCPCTFPSSVTILLTRLIIVWTVRFREIIMPNEYVNPRQCETIQFVTELMPVM